jgi:hypothetical protein
MVTQTALKHDIEVKAGARVALDVPFSAGARVTVFVIEAEDMFGDLLAASESSLDFWNSRFDDEDWNNA